MSAVEHAAPLPSRAPPAFAAALAVWTRVALLSFGGPAGQIAVMHRILVDEKRWIGERRFLHALHFCMLLPGPEAQQLATYLGWLMHGVRGGLVAGALFVLPGFVAILGLSLAYARFQGTPGLDVAFFGLKAAVVAVVVDALVRIGRRALKTRVMVLVALAAFVAMALLRVPFGMIVLASACTGWVLGKLEVTQAPTPDPRVSPPADAEEDFELRVISRPSWRRTLGIAATGLALWWLPVLALALLLGGAHVLVQIGVFFSKVAVLSFGGAYAVLAYVAQEAVHTFGWLRPHEMLDGLGMAETTPGPLIMVVQFVAFMGAMRNPGMLDPTWAAIVASCVATWVTFVPSFVWILVGGPYVERLREHRALAHALSAVTAAVVGVIAHLAVWFALHVWFASVSEFRWGPVRIDLPRLETLDPGAFVIAAGTLLVMWRFRWGLMPALGAAVVAGIVWRMAVP